MFLAICQGLGLAIAAGLIIGAVLPPVMPAWGAVAGAAPLGVLAAGAALHGADEALWPALPVGVHRRRPGGSRQPRRRRRGRPAGSRRASPAQPQAQAPSGVTAIIVLAAVVVAGCQPRPRAPLAWSLSVALLWLLFSRRRQAERKYEGLRVLRR